MARKLEVSFHKKCTTNHESVDVDEVLEKVENEDAVHIININNSQNDKLRNSSEDLTRGEASDVYLAGDNKSNLEADQHLSEAGDGFLEDATSVKSDNLQECEAEEKLPDLKNEEDYDDEEAKALYIDAVKEDSQK